MSVAPANRGRPPQGCTLDELAKLVGGEVRGELRGEARLTDVSQDSRTLAPGALFCAVRGEHTDGHRHAAAAVERGARALLVERWLPLPVPQIRVPWARGAVGPVAAAVHGWPAADLTSVGVTGTNGKTTTAHLLYSALEHGGHATGLVGTVGNRFGNWMTETRFTTPEAPELQRLLARMRDEGADSVVMEASSQALDQRRVDGTSFDVAIWLNLGADHLDYHGTVEQYFAAKAMLLDPGRSLQALVCVDDEWGRRLAAQARIPVTTFGGPHAGADVTVETLGTRLSETTVRLNVDSGVRLTAPVTGEVNAANIAAAYLAARALGVEPGEAARGIASCPTIPGRFERVEAGQPFLVFVDYCHTPDSLTRVVQTAHELAVPSGSVHLVVGCRGEKDRFKRPLTGRVACAADDPILTTDSPGVEDPLTILNQVLVGTLDVPHDHVRVEPDRRKAILRAIEAANPGDVVLIVGRGHERTRHVRSRVEQFDDRLVAAEALAAVGYVGHPDEVRVLST